MNGHILLLELKRKRALVKLAAEPTLSPAEDSEHTVIAPPSEDEDEIEVIDEPEVIVGEPDPDEEWDETPTRVTVNPERYHGDITDKLKGIVPGSGGMMTPEARRMGLEKIRRDHPELFDPKARERQKSHKTTYFPYHEPILPASDRYKTLMSYMDTSKPEDKFDKQTADTLSGLLANLVGKVFLISTGSPILPKHEEVRIVDVDEDAQKIILQVEGTSLKYHTSYNDFFYHKKEDGLTDAEAAGLNPPPKTSSNPGLWKRLMQSTLGRAKA